MEDIDQAEIFKEWLIAVRSDSEAAHELPETAIPLLPRLDNGVPGSLRLETTASRSPVLLYLRRYPALRAKYVVPTGRGNCWPEHRIKVSPLHYLFDLISSKFPSEEKHRRRQASPRSRGLILLLAVHVSQNSFGAAVLLGCIMPRAIRPLCTNQLSAWIGW